MEQLVRVLHDLPEVKLVGRKLGPFSEGEETRVRPWEAAVFEDRDLVKPVEDFSPTDLRKRLMAEEKSPQLENIPSNFYSAVSCKISKLRQKGEAERAGEVREIVDSLITLRIQKLARMAISSTVPRNLPPQEIFLANRLSQALRTWRNRLDSSFEKTPTKEVGAHEEGIWRSVRGIVRDTADIQE